MGLNIVKLRGINTNSQSLARSFMLRNKYGVKMHTPVYAVDASKLGVSIDVDEVLERHGVVEASIGRTSSLTPLSTAAEYVSGTGTAYYVAIHPAASRNLSVQELEKMLEKISWRITEEHMFTLIALDALTRLVEYNRDTVKRLCGELTCVAMIPSATVAETRERIQMLRELASEGIVEDGVVGLSLVRALTISQRPRRLLRCILKELGSSTVIVVYGSAPARQLARHVSLSIASDILQFHLSVDIAGPPRTTGRVQRDTKPRKRLLLPSYLLYYDLSMIEANEKVLSQLIEEAARSVGRWVHAFTPAELHKVPVQVLEVVNLQERLRYTAELRSSDDPGTLLAKTLHVWKENNLEEPLEIVEEVLMELRSTVSQRKIVDYM